MSLDNVTPLIKRHAAEHWIQLITNSWRGSVSAVIETGRALAKAKADMDHGEFEAMITHKLPFKRGAAYALRVIAKHPVLSNVHQGEHLPASWRTLYELAKLSDDILLASIADGTINPMLTRKDVIKMREQPPVPAKLSGTAKPAGNKMPGGYIRAGYIQVPKGHTSLVNALRDAVELERAGMSATDVSKKIGLGFQSYTVGRDVILLGSVRDLPKADAAAVEHALQDIDENRRTNYAGDIIRPIALKVWGSKGNRFKASKARSEAFCDSVSFVLTTCNAISDIEIPHLDNAQHGAATANLIEAISSLEKLCARLNKERNAR